MSKKSNIIAAAAFTLFCFAAITWLSCSKPTNGLSCRGTVCENGGYCSTDTIKPVPNLPLPHCVCPSGYEGVNCETASVDKYLGTWDLHQHIYWSDSSGYIGKDSTYSVILQKTATNTTFFIENFFNNTYYNDIICDIDSIYTSNFTIDTLSDFHMYYDHYKILWGAGSITGNSSIQANMFIRFKNGTSNWQQDSLSINLTPHQF